MSSDLLYPPSVKPGIPRLGKKPKDWSKVKFRDILEIVERPANIDDNSSYQLVTAKRGRGGIVPREILLGQKIKTKTQFFVKKEDFLISKRQIVHGACGLVPEELNDALVSNEYSTLAPQNGLCLKYFNYYSHSIHFQKTCFHASVGVAIEKMIFRINEWMKHDLYLPPYPEQEKIAEILGCWDSGIERIETLIAAKRNLKKGLMQLLLTGKKRFNEFKGQKWKEVRLDKLGKCIRGVGYKPDKDLKQQEDKTTVRLLRSTNIQESRVVREDMQYVVEGRCKKTQYAKQNDILICMSNGSKPLVGKTAYFDVIDDHRYTVGAFCAIYRTNPDNNSDYINHLFNSESYRRQLWVLLAGTNISNLKNSDIENLKFLVPEDSKEQQKIASVLNAADREIELLCDKLEALKNQKKGLMQKLLTGKIRVKV